MPEKRQIAEEKFRRIHFEHRRVMEKKLEFTGVFHSQHRVLMYLSDHAGCSQKEMADAYHISTAAIAIHLKKLEKSGLVERVVDSADNRCNVITLTPQGRAVVEQSRRVFGAVDDCMFRGFSEEELDAFNLCLDKMLANLALAESQPDLIEPDGAAQNPKL